MTLMRRYIRCTFTLDSTGCQSRVAFAFDSARRQKNFDFLSSFAEVLFDFAYASGI
jgi:hypothetical protein